MAESLEGDLVLPPEFANTPLRALRFASRAKLSKFLDLKGNLIEIDSEDGKLDLVNDYSGLAELAGFSYQSLIHMKGQESPTTEMLEQWTRQNATIGNLWSFLHQMERFDVLTDCRRTILNDCKTYEEHEHEHDAERFRLELNLTVPFSEMHIDETRFATRDDVQEEKRTMYDAFICYTVEDEEDRKFVGEIIAEMEVKRNLKLFVPGRDNLPGLAEHKITAYLIEARCRRVVILMSQRFLLSQVCDFLIKYAHALSPGARIKKLISVIRQKNIQIPKILKFLAVCNFTNPAMVEWVWDRLHTAIIAPVGKTTYFEEKDCIKLDYMRLKQITFPTEERLDETE